MKLTSEEFRKKLHSGEIMGNSGRLKFGSGRTISMPIDQGQQESRETKPQRIAESEKAKKQPTKPKVHVQLAKIDSWLIAFGIRFEPEFEFAPGRKFRADRHLPDYGILIEFEGIGFTRDGSQKKTRHTSLMGYTKDCSKYNLATELGYKVYRYTANNYRECSEMLEKLVKSKR